MKEKRVIVWGVHIGRDRYIDLHLQQEPTKDEYRSAGNYYATAPVRGCNDDAIIGAAVELRAKLKSVGLL